MKKLAFVPTQDEPQIEDAYGHLTPSARAVIDATDDERRAYINSDRWVSYPAGENAVRIVIDLTVRPRTLRPPSALFYAPPNMGKSMVIARSVEQLRPLVQSGQVGEFALVVLQCPPSPTEPRLYEEILRAMRVPVPARAGPSRLHRMVCELLERLSTRVLVIDEIQHITDLGVVHKRVALGTLKSLSNTLGVSIVGFGTSEAKEGLLSDQHLAERFEIHELHKWELGGWYFEVLKTAVADLPLRRRTVIDPKLIELLHKLSMGVPGRLFRILQKGALAAIEGGEEHLTKTVLLRGCGQ